MSKVKTELQPWGKGVSARIIRRGLLTDYKMQHKNAILVPHPYRNGRQSNMLIAAPLEAESPTLRLHDWKKPIW